MSFVKGGRLLRPVHAVLFDMDGLLLDSERLAVESDMETLRELGCTPDRDLLLSTLGETDPACNRILAQAYPALDLEAFWSRTRARFEERVARGDLHAKPGAARLVRWLSDHSIPYALASSSGHGRIHRSLAACGLDREFSVIASGDDGVRSKPEPDIFLLAARLLHVSDGCLVLEDSPNGIRAGRRAGMQVVMVPDLLPWREEWSDLADHVCTDLADVITLMNNYPEKTHLSNSAAF